MTQQLPDLWINPNDVIRAGKRQPVWSVVAHNCEVVGEDVRYVPESTRADLERQLADMTRERDGAARELDWRRGQDKGKQEAFFDMQARAESAELLAQRRGEALEFYADPETYHACSFLFDPPTGGWDTDFSEDHGHWYYDRPMPGKRARACLAAPGDSANSHDDAAEMKT